MPKSFRNPLQNLKCLVTFHRYKYSPFSLIAGEFYLFNAFACFPIDNFEELDFVANQKIQEKKQKKVIQNRRTSLKFAKLDSKEKNVLGLLKVEERNEKNK